MYRDNLTVWMNPSAIVSQLFHECCQICALFATDETWYVIICVVKLLKRQCTKRAMKDVIAAGRQYRIIT